VINNDRSAPHALTLPVASTRYTLDAAELRSTEVRLNGSVLKLRKTDRLPPMLGVPAAAGISTFAPATITFLAIPTTANKTCR
jgi:heparanase